MTDNPKPAPKPGARQKPAPEDDAPEPTHTLILANGDTVDVVNGGSLTHYDVGTAGDDDASKPVKILFCNEI
jgi:hypothetical protein